MLITRSNNLFTRPLSLPDTTAPTPPPLHPTPPPLPTRSWPHPSWSAAQPPSQSLWACTPPRDCQLPSESHQLAAASTETAATHQGSTRHGVAPCAALLRALARQHLQEVRTCLDTTEVAVRARAVKGRGHTWRSCSNRQCAEPPCSPAPRPTHARLERRGAGGRLPSVCVRASQQESNAVKLYPSHVIVKQLSKEQLEVRTW